MASVSVSTVVLASLKIDPSRYIQWRIRSGNVRVVAQDRYENWKWLEKSIAISDGLR